MLRFLVSSEICPLTVGGTLDSGHHVSWRESTTTLSRRGSERPVSEGLRFGKDPRFGPGPRTKRLRSSGVHRPRPYRPSWPTWIRHKRDEESSEYEWELGRNPGRIFRLSSLSWRWTTTLYESEMVETLRRRGTLDFHTSDVILWMYPPYPETPRSGMNESWPIHRVYRGSFYKDPVGILGPV